MAHSEKTVWEYVRNKYDKDQDGFVARAEYDRDVESFERMDRNADGRLGSDEFTADVVSMKRMHGWATRVVLMRYFQTGEPLALTWVEIEEVFGAADADGDGIGDVADSCPLDADDDIDGDGICGDVDNAPHDANPGQEEAEGQGIGAVADSCPVDPDKDGYGRGIGRYVDNAPALANPG